MSEQIEIEGGVNLRIFEVVSRVKQEVDDLYEELEILMNKKTVESVERSRKEMQEGKLYDWGEFKKIVDEELQKMFKLWMQKGDVKMQREDYRRISHG